MLGYLRPAAPGIIDRPEEGWYDTGDVVSVDAAGYVTIEGRVKRFAKIGGEMVSLSAVEALAARTWPGRAVATLSEPDPRKGERVILVVEGKGIDPSALAETARQDGVAQILLPARTLEIAQMPVLASGKTDYPALAAWLAAAATRAA